MKLHYNLPPMPLECTAPEQEAPACHVEGQDATHWAVASPEVLEHETPGPACPLVSPSVPPLRSDFFKTSFFFFLSFFRERNGRRKRGREISTRERSINVWLPLKRPLLGTWPATWACTVTGNRTSDTGSQARTQSTEPHQPGPSGQILKSGIIGHGGSNSKEKNLGDSD